MLDRRPAVAPGSKDVSNRYLPVIRVFTREKLEKESQDPVLRDLIEPGGQCSGVLIDSRHIVTAGHCVCMARAASAPTGEVARVGSAPLSAPGAVITRKGALKNQNVAAVIDSSDCAKTSRIETVVYDVSSPGEGVGARTQEYFGTVRPHPGLELLYNDKGEEIWADADLAVIVLKQPVKDVPAFKLATREVQKNDRIVMVGYGPGEAFDVYGDRHSGENAVGWLRVLESGSVEFVAREQFLPDGGPASHILGGDSGGGCLSKDDELTLVGILSSHAESPRGETLSIFTSIYPHRKWLEQQRSIR